MARVIYNAAEDMTKPAVKTDQVTALMHALADALELDDVEEVDFTSYRWRNFRRTLTERLKLWGLEVLD